MSWQVIPGSRRRRYPCWQRWRQTLPRGLHGYLLAKQTGLASGTLYPILIRLADRHLIEAHWEDEQPAGRPRRHLYRLTSDGLVAARTALAQAVPCVAVSRLVTRPGSS